MAVLRFFWEWLKATLAYLLVVAGGLTLFLILSPLFGYLAYSDRPGPGWFGTFPAIGWAEFWANAWAMLSYGAFIALLIAMGGAFCALMIRGAEAMRAPVLAVRIGGGLLSGLVTAWFVMGAAWYIALGLPGWVISIALGFAAGAWILPRRVRIAAAAT